MLIRDARIVDGAGTPWFRADVAVSHGRIAAMGCLGPEVQAARIVEARDRCLMPGFIDPHTHSDFVLLGAPGADDKLLQGVTSQAIGECGFSAAPVTDASIAEYNRYVGFLRAGVEPAWTWRGFGQWLDHLDALPLGTNVVSYVGHATVWTSIMGFTYRTPLASETAAMADLVRACMDEGACGMTSGLVYPPGMNCPPEEVSAVAAGLRERRGVYESHMRNESWNLLACVAETIAVGERNHIPVQIAHHKACGPKNWGMLSRSLEMIDAARQRGVDVTFNQYPYDAGSTTLRAILPGWIQQGGVDELCSRLRSRELRDKVSRDILAEVCDWENYYQNSGGAAGIILLHLPASPEVEGKTLEEAARDMGIDDPLEAAYDLILANNGADTVAYRMMSLDDMICGLRHPAGMIASDSIPSPAGAKAHPRLCGTYPRMLAVCVRDQGLVRLEEAVRRMTSAPARRLGLSDRGLIAPGMAADLVLADLDRLRDNATFADPRGKPEGIDLVLVNGVVAAENGLVTGAGSGRVLR